MKTSRSMTIALVAGLAFSASAMAQQKARPTTRITHPVLAHEVKAIQPAAVLYNGQPLRQQGAHGDTVQVVYDNAPATGGFYFYDGPPDPVIAALDKINFTPGPGAGGPVTLTALDQIAFVLVAGDPGGDFDMQLKFYNTINAASSPVNADPIGGTFVVQFRGVPANTTAAAQFYTITAPIDISAANIVVPDDDFGILESTNVAGADTLHPSIRIGWNGNVTPGQFPSVGASADNFWFDFNNNGTIESTESYWFGGGTFTANLFLKFEGNVGGGNTCYPNCDGSTVAPILNVNDFICFQTKYAQNDTYANCDGSTVPPVLNVNDFICFQTKYAQGCP